MYGHFAAEKMQLARKLLKMFRISDTNIPVSQKKFVRLAGCGIKIMRPKFKAKC